MHCMLFQSHNRTGCEGEKMAGLITGVTAHGMGGVSGHLLFFQFRESDRQGIPLPKLVITRLLSNMR